MRAKRSKRYRKLMHQYEFAFGFREPYQVLVDSHFLQAVYSFKMDLLPALERTIQGKAKPFVTKCSLATMTAAAQQANPSQGYQRRPPQLPPPTVLPLRYCSHNETNTPIDEAACLLSLISPNPESKKNKEHFILATADPVEPKSTEESNTQKRKRPQAQPQRQQRPRYNLRRDARLIPGVPIIYVKRSVMVLEPMSGSSEDIREGVEKGKFSTGITSTVAIGKRKREGENEEGGKNEEGKKVKSVKKVKGQNPLSMKKPKSRVKSQDQPKRKAAEAEAQEGENGNDKAEGDENPQGKSKRKRKHKRNKEGAEGEEGHAEADITAPVEI
ncbi:hypothetical protein FQN57_007022 [Myotisia sp. PD_48]|nr:hypothetical protein FQN57_007022 [Myotisia sp. PD_48]